MAHEVIDQSSVRTCRYTGTNFTAADANAGIVVQLTGTAQAGDYGWPRPQAIKVPAGSSASAGDLYGVVQSVETASTSNRAPSGQNLISVATRGVLKTKKTEDPAADDIGKKGYSRYYWKQNSWWGNNY